MSDVASFELGASLLEYEDITHYEGGYEYEVAFNFPVICGTKEFVKIIGKVILLSSLYTRDNEKMCYSKELGTHVAIRSLVGKHDVTIPDYNFHEIENITDRSANLVETLNCCRNMY